MGRQKTQIINPIEDVRKNLQGLKETFKVLASAYRVRDPNLLWVLYALIETDDFTLTRPKVEELYSKLAKWGIITIDEGQKAIYHLFDAPFEEYQYYDGFLFNVAKNYQNGKEVVILNDRVIIDLTFKMFLGRVAISLSKALSPIVQ